MQSNARIRVRSVCMIDFPQKCLRARTHDQNFVPLIICNKIVTLFKINVPSCQIYVPPCQMNDPLSQINVPLSNKFPKFFRQNHDQGHLFARGSHICAPF